MPQKILHVIIKSRYDGVTSYAVRLIKCLPGYDHSILACYKGIASNEINKLDIRCSHLLNLEKISYKSVLLKYIQALIFFIKNNFAVIHYHHGGTGVLLIAVILRKSAKVIYHLHGGNLIGDNKRQKISIVHLVLIKILSRYTNQVAVANHVYDEFNLKIKSLERLQIIRNAVPFTYMRKTSMKNSLGYVGRFDNHKGFDTFLFVAKKIKSQNRQLNFLAMGEACDKQSNAIKYFEPTFNVEKFYNEIDLLIFPSTAPEGLPLVVLEALAFDVGVIAHPLKGLVEILGKDYPLYYDDMDEFVEKVNNFYSGSFERQKLSELHKQKYSCFRFEDMINNIKLQYGD